MSSIRWNGMQFDSPQFRILSDKQIEQLHFATLQIMEVTGISFDCEEAIRLLGDAGADVSNPDRVKIPCHLVEQALRTAPKVITLYSREGEPAIRASVSAPVCMRSGERLPTRGVSPIVFCSRNACCSRPATWRAGVLPSTSTAAHYGTNTLSVSSIVSQGRGLRIRRRLGSAGAVPRTRQSTGR